MFLFGGVYGKDYYNDLYKYNTFTKTWSCVNFKGKPPQNRYKHEAIITREGNLFIIGGCCGDNRFLDAFEYSRNNNAWSRITLGDSYLYKGRYGFSADVYNTKHLIIFGVFTVIL